MKKKQPPTLRNLLNLSSRHLDKFSGSSRQGYRKSFSSFQVYIISNYDIESTLTQNIIENWVADNIIHALSPKTIAFYLDKMASIYAAVAFNFSGGKLPFFKEVKKKLKSVDFKEPYARNINDSITKFQVLYGKKEGDEGSFKHKRIYESFSNFPEQPLRESLQYYWASLALGFGIRPDIVKSMLETLPDKLKFLDICSPVILSDDEKRVVAEKVTRSLFDEDLKWFAMRMRPAVKFETLLLRLAAINQEVDIPEIFYPFSEVSKRVGRKVEWKGKPVIRNVIFFKSRKRNLYPLITRIYDIAWCYRTPGARPGEYAVIPSKAMETFREAIGFLSSDFEIAPKGKLEPKPGDEVIIIDSLYLNERGRILKKPSLDEDGNKIFRVTLLDRNGRWDIGIDARLIKPAENSPKD
ncbi:MAG: hypothetical protein J1F38_10280 [Muribaculaceae bacterium]|nr:hypothetical protein [Muribaculaceae bacterium]